MVPAEYISVVKFKNDAYALKAVGKNDEKLFKIIKEDHLAKYEKKYGKDYTNEQLFKTDSTASAAS